MKVIWRVLMVAALLAGPAVPLMAQPQPSPDEFVPLSEVPPAEQIPAFRLLAVAYGFVWVALVGYTWSLASRINKIEGEIGELERKGR